MKKPIWLRVVGWTAVVLFLVNLWQNYLAYHAGSPPRSLITGGTLGSFAGFLAVVWVMVSWPLWWIRYKARMQAEALNPVLAKHLAGNRQPPPDNRQPPRPSPVPTSLLGLNTRPDPRTSYGPVGAKGSACEECGNLVGGILYCMQHGRVFCWRCMVAHHAAGCAYVPCVNARDAAADLPKVAGG